MYSIQNTTSRAMMKVLPPYLREHNAKYVKVNKGEKHTINYVAYSVYVAKGKDGKPIMRKDGSNLLNTTAYVGFDDNSYTTVKNDVAIGQLISETGDYPDDVGVYEHEIPPCPVEITTVSQKFGDKSYDVFAFIPLDG